MDGGARRETSTGLSRRRSTRARSAARRVVRTGTATRPPLTLRGRWELELAATLTGVVIVERTGGDIYGGIDALNPIGISDLGLALSVLNDRVTGTAYVRGKALGRLDAVIDAYVDTSGGVQIARNRPFRIDIDAVLPDLSWMGPLIGDSVQVEGSGSIKTAISGTPADPTADGQSAPAGCALPTLNRAFAWRTARSTPISKRAYWWSMNSCLPVRLESPQMTSVLPRP